MKDGQEEGARGSGENPIRVCVLGSGALGGLLGAHMIRAGASVTLVDQGAHLEALASRGLTLIDPDGERQTLRPHHVSGDPREAGTHDIVVLGVKAYDLPSITPCVSELLAPGGVVLPVQNGIPWWYFAAFGDPYEGRPLESLDPGGILAEHIDPDRVIGCVSYVASEVVEPGVVQHREGQWFPVGEPDGSQSPRVARVARLVEDSGLRSKVLEDIRSEIWLKAWGNLSFNPISALTGATLAAICRDPGTRSLARGMMEEAREVAEALGASFRRSIDRRIAGAEAVGEHKTSMLQDLEKGRRLELEALVGSVLELADLTGKPVPRIRAVHALVELLASNRSEEPREPWMWEMS